VSRPSPFFDIDHLAHALTYPVSETVSSVAGLIIRIGSTYEVPLWLWHHDHKSFYLPPSTSIIVALQPDAAAYTSP
jgi:hypothetical protein